MKKIILIVTDKIISCMYMYGKEIRRKNKIKNQKVFSLPTQSRTEWINDEVKHNDV